MALLDDLFLPGGGFSVPATAGFDPVTKEPLTEAEMAAAARDAAALKLASATKSAARAKSPYPWAGDYAEASPFPGMGMGALADPSATAFPTQPPQQAATDPIAGEPQLFQNGVPMPRPRPAEADGPAPLSLAPPSADGGLLPAASTPTIGFNQPMQQPGQPQAAPQAPAAAPKGPSLIDRIFNPNHAATMLALGAGFAGAPSFGTGMSRAFGAAVPAMAADRAFEQKQLGIADTYKALVAKGVPPQEALAAVNNPDIMKATAAKYFETKPRVPHVIGKDILGNDIMGSFDPNKGQFFDAAGQPISAEGSTAASMPNAGAGMLAKGVNNYNPELIGPDYLAQFSPEVKSAITGYLRGDTQPTGNPRLKGFETKVKEWARKYGDDIGVPVSDALFSERRKYRTELGSTGPATAGGAAKAFNQGMEHADSLASKLEAMQNKDPLGIPSVARAINWSRQAFSSKLTGLSDEAKTLGQTLAGEVGKLFSGQAGGGVHERELTRERFQTIKTPEELAGALAGTLETMRGGLTALEQRRDQVLGPNNDVNFVSKETRDKMARIESVIRRLRGEEAPAPAPSAAPPARPVAPPPPGRYQWDPQAGLRPLQ